MIARLGTSRFFALVVALLTGCSAPMKRTSTASAGKQTVQHFSRNGKRTDYLLWLPSDYTSGSGKQWPLIMFLHGAGERGTDIRKVATHGPPKRIAQGWDCPFIVVSPQCAEGEGWNAERLLELLSETIRRNEVDERRIYLTGLSMG